jgi:GDPmannose 4,6-dehydratase
MENVKRIVITGAAGQDGLILGNKLANNGHSVIGLVKDVRQKATLEKYNSLISAQILDSQDKRAVKDFLNHNQPDMIFHFSAKSSVANSWIESESTMETNVFHTLNWLNALNEMKMHGVRFFHASSSEMFGAPKTYPQTEETLLHPRSPYGVSKVAAHHLVINYRESFGQFASTGILFNHESPLRDPKFVTRKITQGVALIARGKSNSLTLGNMDISRDWGWAPDYVDGIFSIASQPEPNDFILATGKSHTLKDFVHESFKYAGILEWEKYLKIDKSLSRPADVVSVIGDSTKAQETFGWSVVTSFQEMIEKMVRFDLDLIDGRPTNSIWKSE